MSAKSVLHQWEHKCHDEEYGAQTDEEPFDYATVVSYVHVVTSLQSMPLTILDVRLWINALTSSMTNAIASITSAIEVSLA